MRDFTTEELEKLSIDGYKIWKELNHNQSLRRDELDKLKDEKFVKMVRHAYNNVPMYRAKYDSHGININQIKGVKDIAKLPIIEKDDLIDNFPHNSLAEGYTLDNVQTAITGGSSGKVVRVAYSDDTMIERVVTAYRIYHMMMDGYPDYYRQTYVYTGVYPFSSLPEGRFPLTHIWTLDSVEDSREKLVASKPHMLTLYPSKLKDIMTGLSQDDIDAIRTNLKCINVKSEMSLQQERDQWSKIFGVPVLDEYGSEELAGTVAAQCPHGGYHIWEDINIVEVVDEHDQVIEDESLGELIATNLYNWAMPIIRYRQGDMIQLKPEDETCGCGRIFRQIGDFKGRSNSKFKTREGKEYSPGYLLDVGYTRLMKYGEHLASWQLIQDTLDNVYFDCIPTSKMTEQIKVDIANEIDSLLHNNFDVTVRFVDDIKITPRGKRNQIISNL
ncbi:phenylacetate--CoA ligase family protein [Pseudoalteromonas sp. S558]|uniref:phenylacetate--CoA ligase family protein n=1 Tax=Pseudoalteromonas sp. S558 TaxID=2066515 RepID=UPI00110BF73E|nr:phenylacetate--CoA ligase family protein [Pseudoalteromonas sp. S558]TMN94657.1 hypothetical protein CWB66_19225 [Pseudoalteromonas sp. S558]